MSIREIARNAAKEAARQIDLNGGGTLDGRSLGDFVADAVAVAVLREIEGELRRHGQWSNTDDPIGMAHSSGYLGAADYVAKKLAAFTHAEPPQPTFMGIPVELREDFPKDAIAFEQGGRFVGGITNLAPAEPQTPEPDEQRQQTTALLDQERRRWYLALERRFGLPVNALEGFAPEVAVEHLAKVQP